ncbi:MAG TPA: M56 family metallopeptidase [Verrucomicrobiae bacterium]|nr:M56 family metallopeptidase [Verrucomicrobiae bacterium]
MILPYTLKLAAFCFAIFFLVHAVLSLAVHVFSGGAIRRAEKAGQFRGARFLLCLRLFPVCFALLSVAALCVPSYLLFEPRGYAEHLDLLCSGAAIFGLAIWSISIFRSLRSLNRSLEFARSVKHAGVAISVPGERLQAWVLSGGRPIFALCGVFRPRLIFSREVQRALSAEEFHVALRHELAHRESRDNLKRLLFLLAPEPLPFSRCFRAVERAWAKLSEGAADEYAASGDPQAPLALAHALVRVARLGAPRVSELSASLIAEEDLAERVERLLRMDGDAVRQLPSRTPAWRIAGIACGALLAIAAATVVFHAWSPILYATHLLLERMIG